MASRLRSGVPTGDRSTESYGQRKHDGRLRAEAAPLPWAATAGRAQIEGTVGSALLSGCDPGEVASRQRALRSPEVHTSPRRDGEGAG